MKPENYQKLFGTDGIRARAGEFPLDSATIRIIGASLARHLAKRTSGRSPRIVMGRDTRESGLSIERDLIAGAASAGATIEAAGVITTPGVAFLTKALPADAGVVISASHNPYQDNGIKVFGPSGRKLDDATERQIESDVAENRFANSPAADQLSTSDERASELRRRYLDYLRHDVAHELSLDGLKIVVDCANGAASEIAPQLFANLNGNVIAINNQPNGRNINLNCGSLHIEALQERVRAERADVGVAFDGDADRALFVDAEARFVDGDATLWVLANYLRARDELRDQVVVATVMTNLGLEVALRDQGIQLVRTSVGDKYVLDELLKRKATLGGEQSGHIIFPNISLAGDGIVTAVNLLRVMKDAGRPLGELTQGFAVYPQILLNVRVREKVPFENLPAVQEMAHQVEHSLGERGRLLLRYSGTEPLARVMIEGEDEAQVKTHAHALCDLIRAEIGASETVA